MNVMSITLSGDSPGGAGTPSQTGCENCHLGIKRNHADAPKGPDSATYFKGLIERKVK